MSIRVALCDDHQIVRQGIRSLLEEQPDMTVVGEGNSGFDAILLATKAKPQIIVLDMAMPELNGIAATRRIAEEHPEVKILALSMYSDQHFVTEMLEAGASGYMLKDSAFSELTHAIRTIMAGGLFISPKLAGHVLHAFSQRAKPVKNRHQKVDLSTREQEILQMISEGKSSKTIAQSLHISVKTVETHRQHIMRKIDCHSVATLTKFAVRQGLTSLEQ